MRTPIRRALQISLVGVMSAAGCNLPSALEKPAQSARYQLQKDEQGRVYRLDTSTGAIVQTDELRQDSKKRASTLTRKASPASTPVRHESTPPRVAVAPDAPAAAADWEAPSAPSVTIGCTATAGDTPQQVVVGAVPAGVFIQPAHARAPLATLSSGARVDVLDVVDEWYLIRFDDDRWGQRAGYVHCDDVQASEVGAAQ